MITQKELFIQKKALKILLSIEFMSNLVRIADPVCLDVPEPEPCPVDHPPRPRFETRSVGWWRLSVLLHGALIVLALSLAAVSASAYAPAIRDGRGGECAALLPVRFVLKGC